MTGEFQTMNPMYVEQNPASIENGDPKNFYDDDGREKRSGTRTPTLPQTFR